MVTENSVRAFVRLAALAVAVLCLVDAKGDEQIDAWGLGTIRYP